MGSEVDTFDEYVQRGNCEMILVGVIDQIYPVLLGIS